ncbi:MAG: hypothetical protein ACJA0B_000972 [Alcanivorax borkumensis]|jgi:hypothetical protein
MRSWPQGMNKTQNEGGWMLNAQPSFLKVNRQPLGAGLQFL